MDMPPLPAPPSLQAYLLGPVQISVRESVIIERMWPRRTARSLLLLLLITPGHRLPRDQVLDALWPTANPEFADSALRKAAYALRRVLEPDLQAGRTSAYLEVQGQVIALRPDIDLWIDIEAFERELEQARSLLPNEQPQRLRQALSFYRNELLADEPYTEWAEPARQRLRYRHRRAVLDLAAGEPAAAITLLERLLQADPGDEAVLRALMGALVATGSRDEALRGYRQTVEFLHAELDAVPEAATRHVADDIAIVLEQASVALVSLIAPLRIRSPVPVPPNPLIGRVGEMERLQDLLLDGSIRLVTMTGPGGVGKTRLAQEVARQVADEFRDGVCFVQLAAVTDPDQVLPGIARALGLVETSTTSPLDAVNAMLHPRELLLVLDNLEHVVAVAPELAMLLEACEGLTILATSREPLRLRAEHLFETPPLPVQRLGQHSKASSRDDAVTLFAERARAVDPRFALTSENVHTVATICARLDGLSLAIELAAARSRSMPPDKMLARLGDRLALLADGYHDLPPRQRTMRDAIAWSHDLLAPAEQALFRRLAVFVGGWFLDAAEAICMVINSPWIDVHEAMEALVDRNLLIREVDETGSRFRMLETIGELAMECLEASGEVDTLGRAHAMHYLALAERAEPELRSTEQQGWFDLLETEHENLRSALAWALDRQAPGVMLRMGAALAPFWIARGYFAEGGEWLRRALQDETAPLPLRATALSAAGSLAEHHNDYAPAGVLHEQALAAWRALNDNSRIASALDSLGNVAHDQGEYVRAIALHEQALVICREADDRWGMARALNNLGVVAYYQGVYERAEAFWIEALSEMRALGDTRSECQALNNLGVLAVQQGDFAEAVELQEQALALRRRLGDRQGMAGSLMNLGEIAQQQGDLERAAALFEKAVRLAREVGDERHTAIALLGLGNVMRERGRTTEAASLIRESVILFSRNGDRLGLAGALESAAGVLAAQRVPEVAARLLGAATTLRERIGGTREAASQATYGRDVAGVRATLGSSRFAIIWNTGATIPLDQAITEALHGLDDPCL